MFLEPNIATNSCFVEIQCFKDVLDVLFNPHIAINTSYVDIQCLKMYS